MCGMAGMSDEQIRAASVDGAPPQYLEIVVADYDPEWPRWFERAGEGPVRPGRGGPGNPPCRVDVGPRLAAKPLIDINLVVADTTDEDTYVPKLETAGYVLRVREPDWFEHRMLRGFEPPVNLHVFPAGLFGGRANAALP